MASIPPVQQPYDTLEALPTGVNGDLFNNQMYTQPRPSGKHGLVAAALLAVVIACLAPAVASDAPGRAPEHYDVDPDTGFRMERYRAPVPDSFPGGVRVGTTFVNANPAPLRSILIDVFPPPGSGADPLDGHWVLSEPHETLPGAIWLPEVGRGYLEAAHRNYFRRNLKRLTASHPDLPVVFFCLANCWQSWNAAKRAADWGYKHIHWYADGTDGWREAGLPLVTGRPLNFFDDATAEK